MLESYNSYQFIIGERSAGMAGAYTAISDDPTAIWYNPAGLANIKNHRINISANSYSYLAKDQNKLWQAKQQDGTYKGIPLEQEEFTIVPNSIIFSYNLGSINGMNNTLSFGILVPMQTDTKAGIEGSVIGSTQSVYIKSVFNVHSKFYIGMIGYGLSLTEKLNFGMSIGIGYYQGSGDATITAYIDTINDLVVANYIENNIELFTFISNIGLQYKIDENNRIGIMYQSPALRLSGEREEITYEKNNIDPANKKTVKKDKYFTKVIPDSINIGYGYEKKENFSIEADLSLHFTNEEKPNKVLNFKIGSEIFFSKNSILRFGFFTDFTQKNKIIPSEDLEERYNVFGASLSYSFAKVFTLIEEKETTYNKLWTTFGIIYQLGKGEYNTYMFDENLTSSSTVEKQTFSRITLFIAESLSF